VSCSTERNTLISRTYHSTTAHYNGYFNANDLLNSAISQYRTNLKEDYHDVLALLPLPNEEEVKNMYVPIDTAVAKCTKVIQRHAMPTMDRPSEKREEYNTWIDENWLTIGIANYYRRDYTLALKNFEYIKKFFATDKTAYAAEMWMARAYIQEGKLTEATFCIANLDKAALELTEGSDRKSGLLKRITSKKKGKKEAKTAEKDPFPNKLLFDLAMTKALFAEKKKDDEGMVVALNAALEVAKKSAQKARLHFILAQLLEKKGDRAGAAEHYDKVLKYNASFEMNFNARLKKALNGGGEKLVKDLNKLLRDPKNAEFKDQIYYTLALICLQESNETKAIEHFTNSAFYSNTNKYQKGQSYEQLGNIYFRQKEYVKAQKYYDSCARVIPENYPNYKGVKNKADKLQALVTAIETAYYEDSVQRIAALSEEDRLAFATDLVKKMKADEIKRKKQEAEKLQLLQAQQSKNNDNNAGGSKWYWNNEKARTEGYAEFKRQWGQRANEDDWRRSEKIVFASFTEEVKDSSAVNSKDVSAEADSLTPEQLLAKLPSSDSLIALSRDRMMQAYFEAGKIYQDQLNEKVLAEKQYDIVLGKSIESNYKLLSAYQIYRMYEPTDAKAVAQRDFILTNYPTSDYAGYLRDPDYFIKKKVRDKETELDYLEDLSRYERGMYSVVIAKATSVIANEKDNPFRAKYYLLKARSQAKIYSDKHQLLPTLEECIAAYPGSDEAKSALEMKNIIEKGYSKNEPVDFSNKSIYTFNENEPMIIMIFLDEKVNNSVAKSRVVDFNKEFFGKSKLNTSSKMFGDLNVIVVKDFTSEFEAADYLRTYKKTKKHLLDMQKFKVLYISQENMKRLFESQKLAEYELFFDENY
jgi:tetratricopeptide (TPR) repeat protein